MRRPHPSLALTQTVVVASAFCFVVVTGISALPFGFSLSQVSVSILLSYSPQLLISNGPSSIQFLHAASCWPLAMSHMVDTRRQPGTVYPIVAARSQEGRHTLALPSQSLTLASFFLGRAAILIQELFNAIMASRIALAAVIDDLPFTHNRGKAGVAGTSVT